MVNKVDYLLEDLVSFAIWRRDLKYHECGSQNNGSYFNPNLNQNFTGSFGALWASSLKKVSLSVAMLRNCDIF